MINISANNVVMTNHDVVIMTQQISVNIFFIFFFQLLQPQFLTDFHKQGVILKLKISSFQPCINYDDSHEDSTDLHQFAHADLCES